jgi:hypothetical protein
MANLLWHFGPEMRQIKQHDFDSLVLIRHFGINPGPFILL